MNALHEIKSLLDEQGQAMTGFAADTRRELETLRDRLDRNDAKAGRPHLGTTGPTASPAPMRWLETKSGASVPVLAREHKFADLHPGRDTPSLGRVLRGWCSVAARTTLRNWRRNAKR
jgi:hypothetical protein